MTSVYYRSSNESTPMHIAFMRDAVVHYGKYVHQLFRLIGAAITASFNQQNCGYHSLDYIYRVEKKI